MTTKEAQKKRRYRKWISKRPHLTQEEIGLIVSMREEGKTLWEICAKVDRRPETIRKVLRHEWAYVAHEKRETDTLHK